MNQTMPGSVHRAAELLLDARRRHHPLDALPDDCRPASREEAYSIQDRVAAALWAEHGGVTAWKTGAPDPRAEPIAAPIGAPLVLPDGVTLPGYGFHLRGVEAELAYRLGRDLPPISGEYHSGLRAGDIVTTGSHTGMLFVEADAAVVVDFPGLGTVSVRFNRPPENA